MPNNAYNDTKTHEDLHMQDFFMWMSNTNTRVPTSRWATDELDAADNARRLFFLYDVQISWETHNQLHQSHKASCFNGMPVADWAPDGSVCYLEFYTPGGHVTYASAGKTPPTPN